MYSKFKWLIWQKKWSDTFNPVTDCCCRKRKVTDDSVVKSVFTRRQGDSHILHCWCGIALYSILLRCKTRFLRSLGYMCCLWLGPMFERLSDWQDSPLNSIEVNTSNSWKTFTKSWKKNKFRKLKWSLKLQLSGTGLNNDLIVQYIDNKNWKESFNWIDVKMTSMYVEFPAVSRELVWNSDIMFVSGWTRELEDDSRGELLRLGKIASPHSCLVSSWECRTVGYSIPTVPKALTLHRWAAGLYRGLTDWQLQTKHSGLESACSSLLGPTAANGAAPLHIDPVCLPLAPVPAE